MIAELAGWRHWIDWVPLVSPMVALAFVFRRVVAVGPMARRRGACDPDGSRLTIALATGLGIAGAAVGGLAPAAFAGEAPDMTLEVIETTAVGGGVGWSVGAVVGWHLSRGRSPATRLQRRLVYVLAATVVLFGAYAVVQIMLARFGPAIDEIRSGDMRLPPVAATVSVVIAIAVGTLLAIAARHPTDQPSATSADPHESPAS